MSSAIATLNAQADASLAATGTRKAALKKQASSENEVNI